MKKIGIDARMWGIEHGGIGRYVMNLVNGLLDLPRKEQLVIFVHPQNERWFKKDELTKVVTTKIPHYSFKEQTDFLHILNMERLDLLHVPHFNIPIWYQRPLVVTIHDLLWHKVRGGNVTTLPLGIYIFKYLAYRWVVNRAMQKAKSILVPSYFVKTDLHQLFPRLNISKVAVTYEGVALKPNWIINNIFYDHKRRKPYILYVGSAYPHKNLALLIDSMPKLLSIIPEIKLVLIGSRSVFWDKIKEKVEDIGLTKAVTLINNVTDEELVNWYKNAVCLVQPSFSEGFGLTGLEAMKCGGVVICANLCALPEIYGDAALYFDPYSRDNYINTIISVFKNENLRQDLIIKGKTQVKQYSWKKMAEETLMIYRSILTPV